MNTNLTVLENFSFVAEVARSVAQLNEAKYAILAVPSSRILGVVALPLAGVADAFAHLFLATGKIATGVIISPYNTFAVTFFPNIAAPVDLEFSSALVHLARIVQGLIDGILLPFICLLNPARVHKMTSHRLPQEASSENETAPETLERQREREEQEREIEDLANRLRQLEAMEPPRDPSVPLPPSNNPPLPPSGNPPPPPPHPSTTPLGSGNPPPPPSGNPPPPPPPHPSTTSSGSGNPPPPDSGARANLLEHIRRGTSLRTPRVLVNSGAGTVPVPVQLVHCHEELFNDPVKFGLFSRSKADFEDFMEDLEWLGGSNNYDGEERRINSVLNNSFVKETGMVKGKVTLVEDDVKALVAYFKLFKKKADDKSNEIIEKRRQEEQEALQRAAQQPTPVVEPKETPLAKRQKELLASLVIKNGHDLQAAIDLLNTKLVKKGRLQQNFRDANEKLHQKDRFKDLDAFIAKYNEIITAINSAQDLSDLSAERIKNIQIIIDAIKKDLED